MYLGKRSQAKGHRFQFAHFCECLTLDLNEKLRFTAVGMLFVYILGLHMDMNTAHTVTIAASVFLAFFSNL